MTQPLLRRQRRRLGGESSSPQSLLLDSLRMFDPRAHKGADSDRGGDDDDSDAVAAVGGNVSMQHRRLHSSPILAEAPLEPSPPKRFVVYFATDEKDHAFFQPFMNAYPDAEVLFLSDVLPIVQDAMISENMNLMGMVEQVVCAGAGVFVGTPYSTFTGYITRIRGYLSRGFESYYTLPAFRDAVQLKRHIYGPFWAREFPSSWLRIDHRGDV